MAKRERKAGSSSRKRKRNADSKAGGNSSGDELRSSLLGVRDSVLDAELQDALGVPLSASGSLQDAAGGREGLPGVSSVAPVQPGRQTESAAASLRVVGASAVTVQPVITQDLDKDLENELW